MKTLDLAALICLCIAATPLTVKADEWDKKTIFTFNAPVEVPGRVLTPGSYVFKLLDTAADRHVVEVFNKDESHLIGTFLTIPDYRMKPADKPLITFDERAAGAPEAIKAWYYPGENYGNEFVYPKTKAVELAKDSKQNVPSMPNSLEANTRNASQDQNSKEVNELKQATISAEKPSGDEVDPSEVFIIAAPATPPPPPEPEHTLIALVPDDSAASNSAQNNTPRELPHTASSLPLLELTGMLLLLLGLLHWGRALKHR